MSKKKSIYDYEKGTIICFNNKNQTIRGKTEYIAKKDFNLYETLKNFLTKYAGDGRTLKRWLDDIADYTDYCLRMEGCIEPLEDIKTKHLIDKEYIKDVLGDIIFDILNEGKDKKW